MIRGEGIQRGGPAGRSPRAGAWVLVCAGLVAACQSEPPPPAPPPERCATAEGADPQEPVGTEAQPEASAADAGPAYVNKGTEVLDAEASGIGAVVSDAAFVDLSGQAGTLRGLAAQAPATAILFTGLGCPVTKAYAPTLEARTKAWRERGVQVLVVSPAILDTPAKLQAWGEGHGWTFRVVLDRGFALTAALGGRRSADAFLLDREGRLRYRGPQDDQYGINLRLPEARTRYLDDAIEALLKGEEILAPALEAPGCKITRVEFDSED